MSVKRAATGAILGAIIGGVVAGGQGAAIGAAIGAGLGATTTLATKGADLEFKTGTQFTVDVTGPTRKNTARPIEPKVAPVPELPSQNFRPYSAIGFALDVPDNWSASTVSSPLSFAPAGGRVEYQGQSNLSHGVMTGLVPSHSQNLNAAAEGLIGAFLRANTYLRRRGGYLPGTLGNREAMTLTMSGISPVLGRSEVVTVHLTLFGAGSMFYLITVVPEEEAGNYQEVFNRVVGSVKFP